MTLATARSNYDRAMVHCDNLVAVHKKDKRGRGRRIEEVSIDRAIVVVAVASWQSAVQDISTAALELCRPPAGSGALEIAFKVAEADFKVLRHNFSTPNAQNSAKLFRAAGFDVRAHWTWSQSAGTGKPAAVVLPKHVDKRIDQWLQLRHAIAHGDDALPINDPPADSVLESVREHGTDWTGPATLRLVDAEQCMVFFRRLVRLSGQAVAKGYGLNW